MRTKIDHTNLDHPIFFKDNTSIMNENHMLYGSLLLTLVIFNIGSQNFTTLICTKYNHRTNRCPVRICICGRTKSVPTRFRLHIPSTL